MRFLQVVTIATAFIVSPIALAQTQVPNEFQSGTPARATEVNANFDALESAIDQNASVLQGEQAVQNDRLDSIEDAIAQLSSLRAPLLVEANSQILGIYISGQSAFRVYTDQGYFFDVHSARNTSVWNPPGDMFVTTDQGVYYDEPGCSGQGWIPTTNNQPEIAPLYSPTAITHGLVFRHESGRTFYVPKNVIPRPTPPLSQSQRLPDGSCVGPGILPDYSVDVLPNDPAVTGVPNEIIQRPIRLVR